MAEQYKILALDDEKFNLLLLKACLKDEDIELVTCTAAPEALAAFKQADFDLVLLDIVMEGIDGFEARKLIRDLNATIPIIFLTSMVDDMDSSLLKRISEDQHTYYLNKSFDKPTLLAKIHQAIRSYREQSESDNYYRQLDADLTLAGDVQKIMLPNWCMSSGNAEVSYLYLPRVKVSGDIFETIDLGDGLFLVLIGDIAGHGIQSALYMSAVQSFLKVLQSEFDPKTLEPNWVLNRINAFFLDDLNGDSYMTCLVAVFDFKRNHLVFH
ncbi:MAG: response regulator, partial [Victivallaceae bacterium]|nr:response regulator [Victivallaceae bacterium]